jgi:hypothetical protein
LKRWRDVLQGFDVLYFKVFKKKNKPIKLFLFKILVKCKSFQFVTLSFVWLLIGL